MNENTEFGTVEELFGQIGFNSTSVFFVAMERQNEPVRERIRRAGEDKWHERPVKWETLVEWIAAGCPEPITGTLALPGDTASPEERAVEFVGPIFERSEQRARGDQTEWVISGYNGTAPLLEERVRSRDLGRGGIPELLRRLACRYLTEREIIAASTGGTTHVNLSSTRDGWMTQDNPYFVARRIDPTD